MNRALIFAGGKGTRMKMNNDCPKQFLEIYGKPIIIHTLERFEHNKNVDDIVVVCIEGWTSFLENEVKKFGLKKVSKILLGGRTGFESRMIGLEYISQTKHSEKDVVLIHDGVRPFIPDEIISKNISMAKQHGNAITIAPATETIIEKNEVNGDEILDRNKCILARAPQTFVLSKIYSYYKKAFDNNQTDIIDSASLARMNGEKLNYISGPLENIKITTVIDFYAAKGIMESMKEYL